MPSTARGVRLGDTAVVVGAGVIGLFLVQALRAAGCGRIIAVDLDQKKLDLACKLGADEGLRPDQDDVAAEVMRRTGGRGADVAIEAVGIAPTVQTAAACLRKGGQLTLVGLLAAKVELPMQAIVTRELTDQQFLYFVRRISRVPRPDGAGRDRRRSFDQRRCPLGRRAGVVPAASRGQRRANQGDSRTVEFRPESFQARVSATRNSQCQSKFKVVVTDFIADPLEPEKRILGDMADVDGVRRPRRRRVGRARSRTPTRSWCITISG